ncbi:MAG: polyphosphate polymerase domain-containing protein [Bacteriovoracaceae bacterium]|nr:polyphosphate polymerase domain-containing protein [Bacteriovoracaceae bacterium]
MRPPRNEYKYLITLEQKRVLQHLWEKYLVKDSYSDDEGKTPILSLYYDSPNLCFYQEKLDGIKDRSKIRLRVYGSDYQEGAPCFLEIKQRFSDKVRKIRVYREKFDKSMFELDQWRFDNAVERDCFGELLARYNPIPTAQVFYIRDAFQAIIESDLRITYDSNLFGMFPQEKLSQELLMDKKRCLLSENYCILEIKNNTNTLPPWVFDGIQKLGLIQRSIPKYITAVEALGIDVNRLNSGEYL